MKLARYEVIRELGKGAMGVVYLAKDPLIGRLVALKTIRPTSVDDEEAKEFQERFVREAQAAGVLNHSAIVTVHDIGQDPQSGISFIAMEYIEGSNLKEVLQQGKGLTHAEVADVIAQVADALDYAHSKGIIHRDVKPANIILCSGSKAKITDFGIAKIASGATNLTTTGQFLGTPNYMAPEQIKGSKIDGRTDLFSLGIVFYEALSRRKPFGGDSLTTISYKIVHEPFPPIRDIDPTIPVEFEHIIARALAKDPADRYQRGRDLAADVRAAIRGESIARPHDANMDVTVINREAGERVPTMEIPFPEVEVEATAIADTGSHPAESSATRARKAAVAAAATSAPAAQKGPAVRPAAKRGALLPPFFKSNISAPIFFGIIAIVLIPLAIAVFAIRQEIVPDRPVDVKREALVNRQHQLRVEAAQQLRAGNVEGAYQKYAQLRQIAPRSPMVSDVIRKLDEVRSARLTVQQRLDQANALFEQGRVLYEQKDYAGSMPLFEEAFHLNPNLNEAVNFLKMSREQLALQESKPASRGTAAQPSPATTTRQAQTTTANGAQQARPAQSATLVTAFDSPVADGYILVKVNGKTAVYENLFEERKGFFRKSVPRSINMRSEVPADTLQIEVWIIVPKLSIQEHRTISDTFRPGVERRLSVSLDPKSKRLDLQLQ